MACAIRALLLGGLLFAAIPTNASDEAALPKAVYLSVNTEWDEGDPHVSSSGLTLFWTSMANGKRELLRSVRKQRNQPWAAGKPLLDMPGKAETCGGFLTVDGRHPQYLYFATNHDPLNEKDQKGDNFDVYFLMRQRPGAEFTTQTPLHSVCTAEDEMHPWLSANGRNLLFSRKTEEGWRVGVASRPKAGGAFGEPRLLDFPPGFHHATLMPDGRTMYLQGPLGNDRWGLFRSMATLKGWTQPEPLESLNNKDAPRGDLSPSLSRDGVWLYFASDRPGGKGGLDLWMVPTAQLGKPR